MARAHSEPPSRTNYLAMQIRFRRSIRIAPGIRPNIGKRGVSATIGPHGASVNVGPRGTYGNLGIPGSGLSVRRRLDEPGARKRMSERQAPDQQGPERHAPEPCGERRPRRSVWPWLLVVLLAFLLGGILM